MIAHHLQLQTLQGKKNVDVFSMQEKYELFLNSATDSLNENEQRDEIFMFMETIATKVKNANLTCDEMDELQELILTDVNIKLREIRNKRCRNEN